MPNLNNEESFQEAVMRRLAQARAALNNNVPDVLRQDVGALSQERVNNLGLNIFNSQNKLGNFVAQGRAALNNSVPDVLSQELPTSFAQMGTNFRNNTANAFDDTRNLITQGRAALNNSVPDVLSQDVGTLLSRRGTQVKSNLDSVSQSLPTTNYASLPTANQSIQPQFETEDPWLTNSQQSAPLSQPSQRLPSVSQAPESAQLDLLNQTVASSIAAEPIAQKTTINKPVNANINLYTPVPVPQNRSAAKQYVLDGLKMMYGPDPSRVIEIDNMTEDEAIDMGRGMYAQLGDRPITANQKLPVYQEYLNKANTPPIPEPEVATGLGAKMRGFKDNVVNSAQGAINNTGNWIGDAKSLKGVAKIGALAGGATLAGTTAYQFLPVGMGKETIANFLPGDDSSENLRIERDRARLDEERNFQRLQPYMLTPQQQMQMGREQAEWAANRKMLYGGIERARETQAQILDNRVNNHINAMANSTNAINNIMSQRLL